MKERKKGRKEEEKRFGQSCFVCGSVNFPVGKIQKLSKLVVYVLFGNKKCKRVEERRNESDGTLCWSSVSQEHLLKEGLFCEYWLNKNPWVCNVLFGMSIPQLSTESLSFYWQQNCTEGTITAQLQLGFVQKVCFCHSAPCLFNCK